MPEDPPLQAPPLLTQPRSTPRGDRTGGVIPYLNPFALGAYYLGIFSVIPGVGFFCALGAVPLGIGGLRAHKRHPEARGTVHAWVGIVLGSLSFAGHLLIVTLIVTSIVGANRQVERARERERALVLRAQAEQAQLQRLEADQARAQDAETDPEEVQGNLLYLDGFALAYFQEHPRAHKVTVRELKAWLPGDRKLRSMSGKDYDDLVIRRGAKKLSIKLSDGEVVSVGTH